MTKKEERINQLSREICNGCRTRHKCENNDGFCIMSDVVAEWLIENDYGNLREFAEKLKELSIADMNVDKHYLCIPEEYIDELLEEYLND